MRIFIILALITLLSIKTNLGAGDEYFAMKLFDSFAEQYLEHIQRVTTLKGLSEGIPNAEKFKNCLQYLSKNFEEICTTVEKAQFFVSAVKPYNIVQEFEVIIAKFDETYANHANLQTMKTDVISTKDKLSKYGDELVEVHSITPCNGFNRTEIAAWVNGHKMDFRNMEIANKLTNYLKHVNGLVVSIRRSIIKSHGRIEHVKLKRLGKKILRSVQDFEKSVKEVKDVTNSLKEIRDAIDELRNDNNGKYFNDMKINAKKILYDLHQLKTLMQTQWTDMDAIFRTEQPPAQLPTVTLANYIIGRSESSSQINFLP